MASLLKKVSLLLTLMNVRAEDAQCQKDGDCPTGDICVTQSDGYYSQCVNCDPDSFGEQCQYMSPQFLEAAEEACNIDYCSSLIQCTSDADCDATNTTQCVTQSDGNYAQCIDCDPTSFGTQCQYWSEEIREAAETTCGIDSCASLTQCTSDADCTATNTTKCVTQADGNFAQCIDCEADSFATQCQYWSPEILIAAESTCDIPTCESTSGQCSSDEDCTATSTSVCAVQADGEYAQCVDCEPTSFQTNCLYWSDAIVIAAQDSCSLQCTSRCPNHSDEECPEGTVCAVESSGYYEQCVDCSADAFETECESWSDDMKAAAEDKCDLTCP